MVIHECVPRFPLWLLEMMLGAEYNLKSKIWCPTDLGVPARRPRKYTIATRKSTMVEVAPAFAYDSSGFEDLLFQTVQADADVFLWKGQSEETFNRLAKNRKVMPD